MNFSLKLLAFFLFISSSISAQSFCNKFQKLSKPEKLWTMAHLFKAKKAFRITKNVQNDIDSIKVLGVIGKDINGGALDAFKHAYWMASLSNAIGARRAWKLGKAHEKGNYLQFKHRLVEDAILPDSLSSVMDIQNNLSGIKAEKEVQRFSKTIMIEKIMLELTTGKLFMIKKDVDGNYLNCGGANLDMKLYKGKWGNPKCLIASYR